jgi:hypothetical protein
VSGDGSEVADAVGALCEATGRGYELRGRLAGGETGAHEVVAPDGDRFVLKWERDPTSAAARRRGARLTERLRLDGRWPVPRQELVQHEGWLFVIQELLPGSPVETLTHALVDEILELHVRRVGSAPRDLVDVWAGELIRTLTVGGDGYCIHESLRTYDARTARLLDTIERIGRRLEPADLPGADIVHWDLHPGNLLQSAGRLTAVIDTDFATAGDARFDLVTLALSSAAEPGEAGVTERLVQLAFDGLTDRQREAYVGHLLLRVVDWPIRRGRPDEVESGLVLAERFLPAPPPG